MSEFFQSLSKNLQQQILQVMEIKAQGADFYHRWVRREIDQGGTPIPRNPQIVTEIKARIASSRRPTLIGVPTATRGRSQLGGLPNLPDSIPWPHFEERPMTLLAQIDLSEVPRTDEFAWLPASGVLFYFAGCRWGEWVEEASAVFYAPHPSIDERSAPPETVIGRTEYLGFEIKDTYRQITGEDDAGQYEDNNDLWSWRNALMPVRREWQIGGWPNSLQGHAKPSGLELLGEFDLEQIVPNASGYTRGFFWVKPDDAKAGRFDQAVLRGEAD